MPKSRKREPIAPPAVAPPDAATVTPQAVAPAEISPRSPRKRCNDLDGKRWLQNSISVWSDIRKSTAETRLKHPALFPTQLVERLIETFCPPTGELILDPFAGTGSTLVAAARCGKRALGLELSADFVQLAEQRLAEQRLVEFPSPDSSQPAVQIHHASVTRLLEFAPPASVDLCITSPPYWDILNQRRTADMKAVRHYGNLADDLGTLDHYETFLTQLTQTFRNVLTVLKPGAYCCIVVMDLRKKNRFYPFHSDLATRLVEQGFLYDDLIIWNRQTEYNNLRPLGYPSVFRVNKVHEFILLMQKPR